MGKPHKVGEKGRHVLNVFQLPTVFHREFSYLTTGNRACCRAKVLKWAKLVDDVRSL